MLGLLRHLCFLTVAVFAVQGIIANNTSAQEQCKLALVLALDSSSLVDPAEYEFQLKGLAAALLDPQVKKMIADQGGISLMAFEWSGRFNQEVIVDWRYLTHEQQVVEFALALASHKRVRSDYPTAMGYALGYAAGLFRRLPHQCLRQVVDVSGDGVHNDGFNPQIAYRTFEFDAIAVNGLVIKGADPDPEQYYRENVVHGPGSFLVVARNFKDYGEAIKQKLLREIGPQNLSQLEIR